jgi:PAS domain S-box-containing protein
LRRCAELREAPSQEKRLVGADAGCGDSANGIVGTWNKGAEHIFGYTAGEAIGQPITIIIPTDLHDEETGILARIRDGPNASTTTRPCAGARKESF